MLRTLTVILLTLLATESICQNNDAKNSFFKQFIADLELNSSKYKEIRIEGTPITWDTTSTIFKYFFSGIDTALILNRPTRKRVANFRTLLADEDFDEFRTQVYQQQKIEFPFARIIKGNRKSKNILTISVSQPLFTHDQKMLVIEEFRREETVSSQLTKVYIKSDDKQWRYWGSLMSKVKSY